MPEGREVSKHFLFATEKSESMHAVRAAWWSALYWDWREVSPALLRTQSQPSFALYVPHHGGRAREAHEHEHEHSSIAHLSREESLAAEGTKSPLASRFPREYKQCGPRQALHTPHASARPKRVHSPAPPIRTSGQASRFMLVATLAYAFAVFGRDLRPSEDQPLQLQRGRQICVW